MTLRLDLADVARMRLISQGLIEPFGTAADAATHLTCTQGQDHPGSIVSLALRTASRSSADVLAAYDAGLIVRSWPLRGTLFVVPAQDLDWISGLNREKTQRATTRRRAELGLTDDVLVHAEALARAALTGCGLTRADLLETWRSAGIDTDGGRGYHHLFHLAVAGVICVGPTIGDGAKEQRFVLTDGWITASRRLDRDDAVRELLRRYIVARGPVPVDDFCWWSKIGKIEARARLAELADDLVVAQVDGSGSSAQGREHWMAPDLPDRYSDLRRRTAAPLLLPGFDEIVLGYGDRSAVLTPAEERLVVPGKNGMFKGTVTRRGQAGASSKRAPAKSSPVAISPFGEIPAAVTNALPKLTTALPR